MKEPQEKNIGQAQNLIISYFYVDGPIQYSVGDEHT